MNRLGNLGAAIGIVASVFLATNADATSPCPPLPPLLWFDQPDWVVAQVTIVGPVVPEAAYEPLGALVEVERVFAGDLDAGQIVIEGHTFLDCGIAPGLFEPGSSWIAGMGGPNGRGAYGGTWAINMARIDEGAVTAQFHGYESPVESFTLDELGAYVDSMTPRAETHDYILSMIPRYPAPSEPVYLNMEKKAGADCFVSSNAITVDRVNGAIKISFDTGNLDIGPCHAPLSRRIPLPPLRKPSGRNHYDVSVFREDLSPGAAPFQADAAVAGFKYPLRIDSPADAHPEVPAQGSVQSGVGIIRGWACKAERVEIQLDERPRMALAYGTQRADTRDICGDSNNGYGAVYAWGLLGPGLHTMRTYIDNVLIDTVEFEVAGLEEEFATGLEATYELEDFPAPGQSVTVRWSEAAQNFIIVGTNP